MAVHRTLRCPRGAGCVEQDGQIVLGDPLPQWHLVRRAYQVLVPVGQLNDALDAGGARVGIAREDHAHARVFEDGPHLCGGQPGIDGHEDETRGRNPEVELQVTVRIGPDDADAVPPGEAEPA